MSELRTDKVSSRTGSGTMTLGGASDTIDASGAGTLTGFGGLKSVQTFTSTGTWTKPTGITKVMVQVVGGGGGAGWTKGLDTANNFSSGGGGAGGTSIKLIDVSAISSESVTVGVGGSGAVYNTANAGAGGTSSFGSHCSADGGGGGGNLSSGGGGMGTGGIGGTATGGDVNMRGGHGFSNNGGSTHGGSSSVGSGGWGDLNNGVGAAGWSYGSGAAGTNTQNTTGSKNGTAGTGGIVIVWEIAG